MANYIIIGGDGKEYGPVSEADVRQWIAEGRLSAESRAKAESDAEFRMLGQFPEFAAAFTPSPAPARISPIPAAVAFSERDYELDIAGCFSRGWELVKGNMGLLFVSPLIYLLIQLVAGALGNIPFIGPLFSLANFLCTGPLLGGIFYLFIRVNRNEPAELGDMFMGFRQGFVQLLLARGADINALACLGDTPLALAALTYLLSYGRYRKLLVEAPVEVDLLDALEKALVEALVHRPLALEALELGQLRAQGDRLGLVLLHHRLEVLDLQGERLAADVLMVIIPDG